MPQWIWEIYISWKVTTSFTHEPTLVRNRFKWFYSNGKAFHCLQNFYSSVPMFLIIFVTLLISKFDHSGLACHWKPCNMQEANRSSQLTFFKVNDYFIFITICSISISLQFSNNTSSNILSRCDLRTSCCTQSENFKESLEWENCSWKMFHEFVN